MKNKNSIILLHGTFEDKVFDALAKRVSKEVFVLEGRPSLASSRFCCKELLKRKITPTLIADNMAGFLFARNLVKEVWLSSQSMDKDGAVCSIGGMILAVLGKRHEKSVKVYASAKDSGLLGKPKEIFYFNGQRVAPSGIRGYVPLVEWVPKKYITRIYE